MAGQGMTGLINTEHYTGIVPLYPQTLLALVALTALWILQYIMQTPLAREQHTVFDSFRTGSADLRGPMPFQ